jgi:hypothetical protein
MISFVEILKDIGTVIKTIEGEVDAFIVSRLYPNSKVRELANEAYERRRRQTTKVAERMVKKYAGRTN